jgi:N-acetylmuramoyl-L-alanine amidase
VPGLALLALLLTAAAGCAHGARGAADAVALVAVDAGHTEAAPGAVGARGTRERDLNVAIAARVARALEAAGLRAAVLDPRGELGNADRAAAAGRLGAAALVSIHHDSVQPRYLEPWTVGGVPRRYSDRFRGFSVFFSRAGAEPERSLALARAIGAELRGIGLAPTLHHAEPIEGEGRELVDAERGVYRYDELAILRHATMPAVLVECGVLVHRDEELALATAERQEAVAKAIARAVASVRR